jgi:serine/threonine protein phosphatase PrpC
MALRLRGSSDKEADVEPFVKPDGAGGLKYLLMCTDGLSNACTEAQV